MSAPAYTPPYTGDLEAVAATLGRGGVALVSTDTVYGLAALPSEPEGVDRLFAIKNRPRTQLLPVMVSDPEDVFGIGGVRTDIAERLIASGWMPGALTLVVELDPARRAPWLGEREELGFRVPASEPLLALLRATGPLYVTSANAHGQPTQGSAEAVVASLGHPPDIVWDFGETGPVASTIVNCREGHYGILREGAVPTVAIEEWIGHGFG